MTIREREATQERANGASHNGPEILLPDRDVRAKRPPLFSFVLRLETLRRIARVVSLLILDFVGVAAALFSALMIKLIVQGNPDAHSAWEETRHWLAFAYLITVLMFARVDLYAERARRGGFAKIATALFQATVIALVFALANGEHFSSYYIFYGSLFSRDDLHHGPARGAPEVHRLDPGPGWLSPAGGAGRLRKASGGGGARAR